MAVVVEPIVTEEKLLALLGEQCEQFGLDYKETLNLGKGHPADLIELAKDVAAMQSNPYGGYIVIGADNNGKVVAGLTAELARHFDEATLRPKLAKYLTAPVVHAACHEVGGQTVALIYVAPNPYGWCVIHTDGENDSATGRRIVVFRHGDVLVRHGTSSERWNDTDRDRLLAQIIARRKESWRKEFGEEIAAQARLTGTVDTLTHVPSASLSSQLDTETFDQLVTELMRREDDIPLRRLLTRAGRDAGDLLGDQDELRQLLDRITTFAALAIEYERQPWLRRTVAGFERIYELGFDERGFDRTDSAAVWLWLDIITRVYALGALAVRAEEWVTVKLLADRRPAGESFSYWGSWLRHAVTMAARAHIFETDEKAGLLARAHNTIRHLDSLHPDRPAEHPTILNSLCQFDVYGALVVIGERGTIKTGNFYTNFARYYSSRATPAFETMVNDHPVRHQLFNADDQLLADAMHEIIRLANQEGFNYNGWDGLESPAVTEFIRTYATADA